MLLSIVIPIYNEAGLLSHLLSQVVPFLENHFQDRFEVILVDDGSLDGTFEEAIQLIKNYPKRSFQLIRDEKNRGKGCSVARGVEKARGKWIFFMDSDLSTPLHYLRPFIERLEKGADIVMASRFEKSSRISPPRSALLTFLSWSERVLVRIFTGLRFSDTQCGFKGFKAPVAKRLFALRRIDRFCFDVEILFLAWRHNLKIESHPVEWVPGKDSRVRFVDLFIFVRDLLKIRWYGWKGL